MKWRGFRQKIYKRGIWREGERLKTQQAKVLEDIDLPAVRMLQEERKSKQVSQDKAG